MDQRSGAAYGALVDQCRAALAAEGLFNLDEFVRDDAVVETVTTLVPELEHRAFAHERTHNIYFEKEIPDLDPEHPALQAFLTANRTVCADQMGQLPIIQLYEWGPFRAFLADVMGKDDLYTMADPLARVNVMGYRAGQALNWHFDRSEFTTTLLLQAPEAGGAFEYDSDLRSAEDPNYAGVADLLQGKRTPRQITLAPGTLNIFKGKNTAHRVTPVEGARARIIAVFSYYERPGVAFSGAERMGFYGRTA